MAAKVYKTTFKFKRGLAATFTRKNLVLQEGEPAYELDTHRLKIGDGKTHWNDLPYFAENGEVLTISTSEIGNLFTTQE